MSTVTTRRKMGPIALTFHTLMMIFTLGLWTPVLLAARRGRKTVTHYDGPPAAPLGQPGQYPQPPYGQQYPPQQPGPTWGQQPPQR